MNAAATGRGCPPLLRDHEHRASVPGLIPPPRCAPPFAAPRPPASGRLEKGRRSVLTVFGRFCYPFAMKRAWVIAFLFILLAAGFSRGADTPPASPEDMVTKVRSLVTSGSGALIPDLDAAYVEDGGLVPLGEGSFSAMFLHGLVAEWRDGVAVFPVEVRLDDETGDAYFLNALGETFWYVPSEIPERHRPWLVANPWFAPSRTGVRWMFVHDAEAALLRAAAAADSADARRTEPLRSLPLPPVTSLCFTGFSHTGTSVWFSAAWPASALPLPGGALDVYAKTNLLDAFERLVSGTNPLSGDTDGDGIPDGTEPALGSNPLLADTDGDGLPDLDETGLVSQTSFAWRTANAATNLLSELPESGVAVASLASPLLADGVSHERIAVDPHGILFLLGPDDAVTNAFPEPQPLLTWEENPAHLAIAALWCDLRADEDSELLFFETEDESVVEWRDFLPPAPEEPPLRGAGPERSLWPGRITLQVVLPRTVRDTMIVQYLMVPEGGLAAVVGVQNRNRGYCIIDFKSKNKGNVRRYSGFFTYKGRKPFFS